MGNLPKAHRIQREINALRHELQKHQERCKHPRAEGVTGANTGNYDPSSDIYWISFYCPTCLKTWRVDDQHPDWGKIAKEAKIVKKHTYVNVNFGK